MKQTQFKKEAEQHQVKYKEKYISKNYKRFADETVKYWLTDEDGKNGKIYYKDFDVFKVVRMRYPNFYAMRDSNMLRSEHIPFNFFVPFKQNFEFCKHVFNEILGNIESINEIMIEYAPPPKERYLNDGTSFDAYIEYTHTNKSKGIIGIEVKYTEKEYKLNKNSKEAQDINDENGKYYEVTRKSNLYRSERDIETLKKDKYRQIWRNHLLAESILLADDKFKHAHSLIFYPQDNDHFTEVGKEYCEMLADNKDNKFGLVTYEHFIEICRKKSKEIGDNEFEKWTNYLQERYIIKK